MRALLLFAVPAVVIFSVGCATPAKPSDAGLAVTRAQIAPMQGTTQVQNAASQSVATLSSLSTAATSSKAGEFGASNSVAEPSMHVQSGSTTDSTPVGLWDGEYIITLHTRWFAPVSARMFAQPTADGFKANTPPNVAWSLVGGMEGNVGPLLAPFIFPSGMILTWNSLQPVQQPELALSSLNTSEQPAATNSSQTPTKSANASSSALRPGEGSIGPATLSRLRIKTRIASPGAPVELVFRDDRVLGVLTVKPVGITNSHHDDYKALAAAIASEMPSALYDPALAKPQALKPFFDDVALGASRARDDLEFMFAGAAAARKHITFQMPIIFPKGPSQESLSLLTKQAAKETTWVVSQDEKVPDATFIRFDAFINAAMVDDAFTKALIAPSINFRQSENTTNVPPEIRNNVTLQNSLRETLQALLQAQYPPKALVIDLRTSSGIEVDAFRVAQWIIAEPLNAGAYVGGKLRQIPKGASHDFDRFELRDLSDYPNLREKMHTSDGVEIVIMPISTPTRFDGPVIVLTSKRTSSSSEALVAALKRSSRVTVIGEPTAGKPMLTREVSLQRDLQGNPTGNWVLRVAGFDLLVPQGADAGSSDGRGGKGNVDNRGARQWQRSVVPHVIERSDPKAAVARELKRKKPS